MNKGQMKIIGTVEVILRDKDGNIKLQETETNLVVDQGLNLIKNLLTSTGATVKAIGVGWYSTDPSNEDPGDKEFPTANKLGESRKDISDAPNYVISVDSLSPTFTIQGTWGVGDPSPSPVNITALGLFTAKTGITLFCWKKKTAIGKDPADELQVNYTITIQAV